MAEYFMMTVTLLWWVRFLDGLLPKRCGYYRLEDDQRRLGSTAAMCGLYGSGRPAAGWDRR